MLAPPTTPHIPPAPSIHDLVSTYAHATRLPEHTCFPTYTLSREEIPAELIAAHISPPPAPPLPERRRSMSHFDALAAASGYPPSPQHAPKSTPLAGTQHRGPASTEPEVASLLVCSIAMAGTDLRNAVARPLACRHGRLWPPET
eukprot:3365298-Rhodomonas_salina.1